MRRLVAMSVLLAGLLGIAEVALAIEIGEVAPDFTLPSTAFLIDKEGVVQGKWLPEKQAALFESDPMLQRAWQLAGQ